MRTKPQPYCDLTKYGSTYNRGSYFQNLYLLQGSAITPDATPRSSASNMSHVQIEALW